MSSFKETEDVQNIISRLEGDLCLNTHKPPVKIIKQYARVQKAFIDLRLELDVLNTMKEEFRG